MQPKWPIRQPSTFNNMADCSPLRQTPLLTQPIRLNSVLNVKQYCRMNVQRVTVVKWPILTMNRGLFRQRSSYDYSQLASVLPAQSQLVTQTDRHRHCVAVNMMNMTGDHEEKFEHELLKYDNRRHVYWNVAEPGTLSSFFLFLFSPANLWACRKELNHIRTHDRK